MGCIEREVLEDLVDGELGECETARAIEHIRSCSKCKREFSEILALYEGLQTAVVKDVCPSQTTLEAYTQDALPSDAMTTVRKHLEFCCECRSYVWLLTASESELANWQAQEEQAHKQDEATSAGRAAAREVLAGLLPAGLEFLDWLWDSACTLVRDLRGNTAQTWPPLGTSAQLTGALGFAGSTDPQGTATAIILVSTLYVADQIAAKEIGTSSEEIATAVHAAARTFGAGKELQKRLAEIVPPILQRFYGPSKGHPCV
jgi:hypothetical protein